MGCGTSSNVHQPQPMMDNNNYPKQQTKVVPTAPMLEPEEPNVPPKQNDRPPEQAVTQQEPPPVDTAEVDTPLPTPIPELTPEENNISNNNKSEAKITEEVLQEFVDLEKKIHAIEENRYEEKLYLHQIEYKNVEEACRILREEYDKLKQETLKEYNDVAQFDLVSFMVQNNITVISSHSNLDEQRMKEEYEYFEAKNRQDVAEKQIQSLETQLNQIGHNIENARKEVEELTALRTKVDGLLENIFNGEYGSELEDRLELEAEQLLQYKKHLSLAHYKWWNGRQLLHHACSQIAYSVRRWTQIQEVADHNGEGKYHMITDTRNHLIAGHQNLQRCVGYLKVQLPYWTETDDKNLVSSINAIYNDVKTGSSYEKSLRWYHYYHWRFALLLNWMDQVINNKIVADHNRVSKDFRSKYNELRVERLKCIKEKVAEVLGVDMNIEQFSKLDESDDGNEEDMLPKVESDIAINPESFASAGVQVEMPAAKESEYDPTLVESIVLNHGTLRAISMGTSTEVTTSETGTDSMNTQPTESGTDSMAVGTSDTGTDSMTTQTAECGTDSMAVGTSDTGTDSMTTQTAECGTDSIAVGTTDSGTDSINVQTAEAGTGPDEGVKTAEMSTGTEIQTETETGEDENPPEMKLIPLSDLAPPPSTEQLFGNVEQLQLIHQQQLEELEKVQELNKTRQEQGLQEKLRQRQSKRRKQKLQEQQENALTSP